ncbi:MAG: isochorismatase family protein [Fimbriiglobus sp.]
MIFDPKSAVMLVVDVQEKLLPVMPNPGGYLRDLRMLLEIAMLLDIPRLATEQYPKGLGATAADLRPYLPEPIPAKTTFSAHATVAKSLAQLGRKDVVLTGMETPICVYQTGCDLLAAGYRVLLPTDAVVGRRATDHAVAIEDLVRRGAIRTTIEMLAFAWLADAAHPQFKAISKLVVNRS